MQNPRKNLGRKQWTIFMRKQWIVLINVENRYYECSKHIQIYSYNAAQFFILVVLWSKFKISIFYNASI